MNGKGVEAIYTLCHDKEHEDVQHQDEEFGILGVIMFYSERGHRNSLLH